MTGEKRITIRTTGGDVHIEGELESRDPIKFGKAILTMPKGGVYTVTSVTIEQTNEPKFVWEHNPEDRNGITGRGTILQ